MSARLHTSGRSKPVALGLRIEDRASQIVEFALSVPLLVLFVVGIFDFTGALALKHKLANAAREGARVAAADPANDLSNTSAVPVSVSDAYQVVDNYLLSEKINDCGLQGTTPTASALTWTSPALTGCQNNTGLVLSINRGCISPQTVTFAGSTVPMNLVGTCVTLVYPYVWQFTSVAGLFSRFTGPTNITTSAIAFNQN
jgi:Flp pilus assembly protein TadG